METDIYYLYFDDSGIRFPDKKQIGRDDGMDCFALGGILIHSTDTEEDSERSEIIEAYKELRRKWRITYPLRSADIRGKRGNYVWLNEQKDHDAFFEDLNNFLLDIPAIGFAAVIDRTGYNIRYEAQYGDERWWMCKTAYAILIERVAKFVDSKGGRLKVRFEKTGKKEDRAILEYHRDLKEKGMPFDVSTSSKYAFLSPEDFRRILKDEPERQEKKSPLLQVADVYLYPMVKGGYDKSYKPYRLLMDGGKLVDALLNPHEVEEKGIKYSCFEINSNK